MSVFQCIQEYETLLRPSPWLSPKNANTHAHVNLGTRRASRSSKGSRSSYGSQITSHLFYADAHTNNEELSYVAAHTKDQEQEQKMQTQTDYSIPIFRACRMLWMLLHVKPLTLSDIVPSPAHVRSLSEIDMGIDMGPIIAEQPPSAHRRCMASDFCVHVQRGMQLQRQASALGIEVMQQRRKNIHKTSGIRFEGFTSFEEVRRSFEFHYERPSFYSPAGFVLLIIQGSNRLLEAALPQPPTDLLFSLLSTGLSESENSRISQLRC
ncbi:hypothetical protein CVT25_004702 [Psilocybe cyanescens]|uniref:Uncharacterized protein n=1 Tax=Psilocybe cyanescens TaxID=93625 RepID=A0A409XIR2_PSICY|nr:hypothetical protein CVT25_004702 [Psilocybe cyanescens]